MVMGGPMERSNSIGWVASDAELNSLMMARRNSSLGLSMMTDRRGSLGSLGPAIGLDPGDPTMPPHRPLVGGGAAAAYEAARHDHFTNKSGEQHRRASSIGLGSLGNMGMSVNPNQHYEMLKLHHMNLLNEIQETTLMMNLYQQQQLQQQQQQLQQQANAEHLVGGDPAMAMLLQQSGSQANLDMFGSRASLGLGGPQLGGYGGSQMQMLQQQQVMQGAGGSAQGGGDNQDQTGLENRIAQLKQDIARNEPGAPPSGGASDNKRGAESAAVGKSKRSKIDDDDGDEDEDDDDDDDEEEV